MKFILTACLIALFFISGCNNNPKTLVEVQGIIGYIVELDNAKNTILVFEAQREGGQVKGHLITIENQTLLKDANNNKIQFSELQIGQKVNAVYYMDKDNPFVLGSFPQPMKGSKVLVQPEDFPDILPIDETKAIAIALQSDDDKGVQLFVRNVDFNNEDKTWMILIDDIITMENKKLVKIDSKNGNIWGMKTRGAQIFHEDGKEYRTIPIDAGNVPRIAEPGLDQTALEETELADDREKLTKSLKSIAPDLYAGSYTDEMGNNIFLLTDKSPVLEAKLKTISQRAEKVKIQYAKHTEKQLNDAHNKLNSLTNAGIIGISTDTKLNKVTIFISESALSRNKDNILKYVNEDMINWQIGDYKMVDQSAILYPGEQVDSTY